MKLLNKDEYIANEIKFYLIKNKVQEGYKLPSEREISERYGAQRATVRSAYAILEEEGIIEIRERSGRYMGHPRVSTDLQRIKSFTEKVNDLGIETENKLISFELIEVDKELSKKIKLQIGTPLYKITRIRKIKRGEEDKPIAIEYAYIPENKAPKLMKFDLEERSLFEILNSEYGCIPEKEEQVIEIVYANDFEANALNVDKMTAIVRLSGLTYDSNGDILQYLNAVQNKEWVKFEQINEKITKTVEEGLNGL